MNEKGIFWLQQHVILVLWKTLKIMVCGIGGAGFNN
jgi:hypothetical protein